MQISNEFVFSPTTDSSFLLSWSDAIHSCAGKNDDESENDIFLTIIFILGKCEEQGDRAWDEMGKQTYHSEQEAVPWYPKQNTQEDERGKIPLCPENSSITGQNLYKHTHTKIKLSFCFANFARMFAIKSRYFVLLECLKLTDVHCLQFQSFNCHFFTFPYLCFI